mgnify:CR=1 FL=1
MDRNYGIPAHMNLHQFRMAQRRNQFSSHVQYLRDTGNTDELARLAGIFDRHETSNFLFEHAKGSNFSHEAMDLFHRLGSDPDTMHIGLSDDGPDFHLSGVVPRSESTYARAALKKKYRERLVQAEGRRAQIKGFDSPPSGPARDPDTLKTKLEGGITYSLPRGRFYV